jgi:hypothetical protein
MRMRLIFTLFLLSMLFYGCKKKDTTTQQVVVNHTPPLITSSTQVMGYNLLSKICGIWDGGVVSETALGSYPEWIVDFRPYSAGQVGAKNELDTANNIFMSFFICYHDSAYKLAFRNGGSFHSMSRVSYMEIDSVSETGSQSFYRFADFVKGMKRDIVDITFKQDSLIILAFTNVYNTEPWPTPHMQWRAKLQDTSSCQVAIAHFNFPQKVMVQNFSTTFAADSESVFYQGSGDPYPASAQPYVGQATLSYTAPGLSFAPNNHVFLLVTTQPLISGFTFNTANMIYRSRYVILDAYQSSFTFTLMHPGSYYLYAYYDANGDGVLDSGDYVSTANVPFTLGPAGTVAASTVIDYQIP